MNNENVNIQIKETENMELEAEILIDRVPALKYLTGIVLKEKIYI